LAVNPMIPMKKILAILTSLLPLAGFAQFNFVQNGSFEQYTHCPDSLSGIEVAPGWYSGNGNTPDYFNACNTSLPPNDFTVPHNCIWFYPRCSYQEPRTGSAYAGFAPLYPNGGNYSLREYVSDTLIDTLTRNKRYGVIFFVSLANTSNVGIKDIGAYFSDTALYSAIPGYYLSYQPQVINTGNYLEDTLNWMQISGIYQAHGGEGFITIGCFLPLGMIAMDTIGPLISGQMLAYYYIDDVSITEISSGIDELSSGALVHIHPNPAKGAFHIDYPIPVGERADLRIFDLYGKLLEHRVIEENSQSIDCANLEPGIYVGNLSLENGRSLNFKIVIAE